MSCGDLLFRTVLVNLFFFFYIILPLNKSSHPSDLPPWQTCLTTVVLNHCHMSFPQAEGTSSRKCVVKRLTSGWHCLSESPQWNGSHGIRALSGLFRWSGCGAMLLFPSWPPCVFIYPLWPLSQSQSDLLWALTTGNTSARLALFPNWPQGFTVSLKKRCTSLCHKGTDNEMKSAGHSVAIILC